MKCITPSNDVPIPNGESLNVYQLIEKLGEQKIEFSVDKVMNFINNLDNKQHRDDSCAIDFLKDKNENLRFLNMIYPDEKKVSENKPTTTTIDSGKKKSWNVKSNNILTPKKKIDTPVELNQNIDVCL